MNIRTLRNLVDNGWNISNRKNLEKLVGKEEYNKLKQGYINIDRFDNFERRGGAYIPSGEIELQNKAGQMTLQFPVSIKDMYVRNNTLRFTNKDINLKNIIDKVKSYQARVVEHFTNAKELPESALKSKTMEKLYSPKFKVAKQINKDGYYVTTIIDKNSGEPVKAYVKCLDKSKVKRPFESEMDYEQWGIFVKNNKNEYDMVGKRSFRIDRENNCLKPDWMDSQAGFGKYKGIGLRAHQIGVERMMQEGLNTVEICALPEAFPFHYKSGFRIKPMQKEMSQERIDRIINNWSEESGLTKEELEAAMVTKNEDGKIIVDSKTQENWHKLLYLKNNGKIASGDTPMTLQGEWLERWKQMAKSQPILLD